MKPITFDNYYWRDELVILRGVEEDDWEIHYYNRFDTHGRRLVNYLVEMPPTIEEAKSATNRWGNFDPASGRIMFTILNHDGEIVGGVNLNSIDERNGTFSIGIQVDRDNRGKGYGTAAMRLVLRYAFFERRLNKFLCGGVHGHHARHHNEAFRCFGSPSCRIAIASVPIIHQTARQVQIRVTLARPCSFHALIGGQSRRLQSLQMPPQEIDIACLTFLLPSGT